LAAGLTEAKNRLAGKKNVRFDFSLLDVDAFVAKTAFEVNTGGAWPRLGGRREFDLPEIEIRVAEGDAVNVAGAVFTEAANEADVGFAARIGEAHGEDFVRGEFIARANTGAVETEDESMRFLREDAARGIRTEEDDGDLLGNATASAHTCHRWPPEGP